MPTVSYPFSLYPLKKSGAQRNATPAKSSLVDSDAHLSQFSLGLVNLGHELLVRLRHVVEGEDAPAEAEEEECAEGDEGPEGEDGDDLLLDQRREGDEFEKEGQVEGGDEEGEGDGLLGAGHCSGFFVEA